MKKISKYLLIGFLAVVSMILLYAFLAYPAAYAKRALLWGDSDVYDYLKFPERPLTASETPYQFSYDLDEEPIRARFEALSGAEDFDKFLEKKHTQAFIVIRDDAILYEQYFNGGSRDSIVTSFSTAKSFDSALIGIAISEGYIHSVEDPITEYLPELAERDPAFARITIRDVLMMSSGIRYVEFPFLNGDNTKTYYFPDLRQLALNETRITGSPGEQFHYNNYHPLLLGLILERSTGHSVAQYLQDKIWSQVGMEFDGSWSLDEVGFEKMESGINARAIDFAKFGRLFLRNGDWDGVQVIPGAWVAESTQADTTVDYASYYYDDFIFANGQGYYKYMWWGIQRDAQNSDFMALGNHGQLIYISPEKNLIILRFGESSGYVNGSEPWVEMFYQFAETLDG